MYAPNRDPAWNSFFETLPSLIDPSVPTVLTGDFNTVFDRATDRRKARIDNGFTSCLDIYHSTLAEIAKLDLQSARGAQARWVQEGKSSSAYFFRLEKKRATDRWIAALKKDDGSIVSDPVGLSDCLSSFHAFLFSAESSDESAASEILDNVSSILPSDQAALCEGELTLEECFTALTGMARGKEPSLDGLPMEFYLKFWHILGPDLVNTLNSCYLVGTLALSQRRGVISLAFKKGERLDPCNWRPITILNVDYKLVARALAEHLLKVIHLVVADDQSCGVPGRYIGENVALVQDAATFASQLNVPLALLTFDQEKAFDRVDWDFMNANLVRMGFQPSFLI